MRTAAHTDTTSTTSFFILELIPQFFAHNKDPKLEHSAVCNVLPKTINGGVGSACWSHKCVACTENIAAIIKIILSHVLKCTIHFQIQTKFPNICSIKKGFNYM